MADKPYTSNMQRLVDMVLRIASPTTMPETSDAVIKRGAKRFISDPQDIPNRHPAGIREGSIESLIKALGARYGTLIDSDQPYLEQYLHPDVDILPRTSKRPVILPTNIGDVYRRPEYTYGPLRSSPGHLPPTTEYANVSGLGNYSNEDVPSTDGTGAMVHDRWDFDTGAPLTPPGFNAIAKKILNSAGKAYSIYGPYVKSVKE